jgi:hypothetical protein
MIATLATKQKFVFKKPLVQIPSSWPCEKVLHISKRIDLITRDLNLWALKKVWGEWGGDVWGEPGAHNSVLFQTLNAQHKKLRCPFPCEEETKNTYVWMIVTWLAILPSRVRPGMDVNFIWSLTCLSHFEVCSSSVLFSEFIFPFVNFMKHFIFYIFLGVNFCQSWHKEQANRYAKKCQKRLMYLEGSLEMGKSNTYGIATSCRNVTSFFNTWLFALFFCPFQKDGG